MAFDSASPLVHTTSGDVIGEQDAATGVSQFRGIPYSAPVGGESRFSPVGPAEHWEGTFQAVEWPHPVPQMGDKNEAASSHHFGRYFAREQSEGPLSLNVWSASLDESARQPVVLWLHGGGFITGEPTRIRESGHVFAENGVVVVSPTHRLGALGYLYLHGLNPERYPAVSPGLADMILSLQWVQQNITRFGGDPDNVTIMGESGGAAKVHTLLGSPAARELFHKVVMLAGATSERGGLVQYSPDEATATARDLLAALGIAEDQLDELHRIDAQRFIDADEAYGARFRWAPVVDGDVLPTPTWSAVRRGDTANIPSIIGSTRYEAEVLGMDDLGSLEWLTSALDAKEVEGALTYYRDTRGDEREAIIGFNTDYLFRIPGIRFAEDQAAAGSKHTYQYLFDYEFSNDDFPSFRATHGAETYFIFGTTRDVEITREDDKAADLARSVQDSFIAFFRAGEPAPLTTSGGESVTWNPYTPDERATLLIRADSAVVGDPDAKDRETWAGII